MKQTPSSSSIYSSVSSSSWFQNKRDLSSPFQNKCTSQVMTASWNGRARSVIFPMTDSRWFDTAVFSIPNYQNTRVRFDATLVWDMSSNAAGADRIWLTAGMIVSWWMFYKCHNAEGIVSPPSDGWITGFSLRLILMKSERMIQLIRGFQTHWLDGSWTGYFAFAADGR